MGRTVPTFVQLIQQAAERWKKFRRALRREDHEHFDRLFVRVRYYTQAAAYQCHDNPMEAILLSIALDVSVRCPTDFMGWGRWVHKRDSRLQLYNSDLMVASLYCWEKHIFPLAYVEVETDDEGKIQSIECRNDEWALNYEMPPSRSCRFGSPDYRGSILRTAAAPLLSSKWMGRAGNSTRQPD